MRGPRVLHLIIFRDLCPKKSTRRATCCNFWLRAPLSLRSFAFTVEECNEVANSLHQLRVTIFHEPRHLHPLLGNNLARFLKLQKVNLKSIDFCAQLLGFTGSYEYQCQPLNARCPLIGEVLGLESSAIFGLYFGFDLIITVHYSRVIFTTLSFLLRAYGKPESAVQRVQLIGQTTTANTN